MNLTHVETKGSIWLIDDDGHRYCRMPKTEGPREPGDWPDPTGTPLEDLRWMPMFAWRISDEPVPLITDDGTIGLHGDHALPLLVIEAVAGRVVAPNATVRKEAHR